MPVEFPVPPADSDGAGVPSTGSNREQAGSKWQQMDSVASGTFEAGSTQIRDGDALFDFWRYGNGQEGSRLSLVRGGVTFTRRLVIDPETGTTKYSMAERPPKSGEDRNAIRWETGTGHSLILRSGDVTLEYSGTAGEGSIRIVDSAGNDSLLEPHPDLAATLEELHMGGLLNCATAQAFQEMATNGELRARIPHEFALTGSGGNYAMKLTFENHETIVPLTPDVDASHPAG